ncbi:MAG: ATP-dependent helicase, partial [Campylobacterales bacterium]|nr:ATP-dependent helicase [Campylobacterales bacterium]
MPLSRLNNEQLTAATADNGHNLIIASAGTGKTSTIVGRIAHLIQSGVKPEEILLLTFTNKAAAEMIGRLSSYFGKDVANQVTAGTFHAVSYKWLKKENIPVVLKQPGDLKVLFKSVFDNHDFSNAGVDYKPLVYKSLLEYYWLWQNTGDKDFYDWLVRKNEDHKAYLMFYQDVIDSYEKTKDELGFAGFNDLLLNMVKALENNVVESPFKEVLVDEYQDTNPLQNRLLEAIQPPSIFCVGDYDQSIYAFNGAQIEIIATFDQRYDDATVFTLDKNYRSTKPILKLATKVIEYNERIYPKNLTVFREDIHSFPTLLEYDELFTQYQGIAEKIKASEFSYDETAVIFRNNSSADGIEAMLRELGIPCRRKGSNSFFDALEVKALLDIFMLFVNPKDVLAFIHIFEYSKGIGSGTAKEIYDGLLTINPNSVISALLDTESKTDFFKTRKAKQFSLFDEEELIQSKILDLNKLSFADEFLDHQLLNYYKLNNESIESIYKFYKLIKKDKYTSIPSELISNIISSDFYQEITETLAKKRGTKNHQVDENLVQEARERIKKKTNTLKELSKHYSDNNRFINAMVLGGGEMSQGEGVNLLSVHASKGLEFVFFLI